MKHRTTHPKKRKRSPYKSKQRVFTKKYSDESVDKLKRLVISHSQRGEERYYAIKVDNEFCVTKTANPNYFDDYKEFVDGSTESVEIVMYFGSSNNCNRHLFYLREGDLGRVSPQVDVEQKIAEAVEKRDKQHKIQHLESRVKELEKYIEHLEDELEEEPSNKNNLQGVIRDSTALVEALKGLPFHMLGSKKELSGAPQSKESEVEVEVASEDDQEEVERTFFNQFQERFGKQQLNNLYSLMVMMERSDGLVHKINQIIKSDEKLKKEREKLEKERNKSS